MTQEDKELLLKDLCGRLPYRTCVLYKNEIRPLFGITPTQGYEVVLDNAINITHNGNVYCTIEEVKPYLFPMSSIIKRDLQDFDKHFIAVSGRDIICSTDGYDWLNKNHFDYRGLIEKSLALDATGLNIY